MAQLYFKVGSDVDKVIKLREEIERLKSTLSGMDGNTAPATIRAMEVQLAKNTKEMDALIVTAVRAGNEMEHNFKKKIFDASQAVNTFSDKIIDQKAVIRDVESDVKNLATAYSKMNSLDPNRGKMLSELNASKKALSEEKATLFGLQQEQSKSRLSVKRLRDEYALYNNEGKGVQLTNDGMSVSFGKILGVIGGVGVLKELASEITTVTGQFQRFENVLTNALGGDNNKAKTYLGDIADFAAKTNFQLDELTDNFLKFVNRGVTPTMDSMTKLGDFTNSVSKPYAQLSEAILDINNPERWKEFGVQVQTNGSKVNLTFRGMKIEADRTVESVMNAIEQFGSMDGIEGSTEAIAGTIEGQMSNLKDTITSTLNEIGQANSDIISGGISTTSTLIENYDKVGRVLVGLVATYGVYRTALMFAIEMEKGYTASQILKIKYLMQADRAQKLLNKTMLSNPYVAVAVLVIGLSAGIWALSKNTTEAEKAQKRFNDAVDESEKGVLSEQRGLAKLKGELAATTKGTDEYNKIRDQIVSKYGKYKEGLQNEIDKVGLLDETYQSLTESIKQSFNARQYDKFKQEQETALDEVMSNNLGKIQDRLYKDLGDEEGSRVYAKIHLALLEGKELDKEIKATIDEIQDKGTILADSRIDSYIKNIRNAQQATDEFDKKARDKFGIDGSNEDERGKGDTKELSTISDEIDTATKKVSTLKQELADLRNGKTSAEADKTVKDTIDAKLTELKAAEDALSTLTGKDTASDKKASDEQKRALEARKKLNEELLSLRMQNQQAEINLMAEGREKRLAQIEFDYDSEIAVILAKEKEWKEAQGGKLTEDQTKEIHVSFLNSYVKKVKSTATVDKDQLEAEKQAMNEYLAAYGNYQEKRKAITEKYNDLITKATTEGEKLSLAEEMRTALSDLDMEVSSKTSAIGQLFDDMSKRSVADMRAIADAAEQALSFITNGEWDEAKGGELGISKESFDTLRKSPKELESIKNEIANVKKEADQCETSFNKISGGLKKMFSSGGDTKKFQEGLAEVSEGMNDVMQAGQFLSDSLSELGNAFGNDTLTGIAEGVNVAMDAMGSAMDGAKAGAAFGPWGAAAGAAIGMVTSLASSFAKIHDAKNEKRIAVLQEQIETLDKSYDMLGDAIDKAYSKDASNLIDQQNKLLEQQKVLIRQQIREEEDKKKTDDDRIKEWREQLEEIDKTLADNKEKAVDAIFGEDLQSAIDNFAQAYADAWASGEDRAKSMKDVAKKMIQSTIVEMIKSSAGLGETVKKIREMITGYLADDGVVSDWEQGQLDAYIESETAKLDGKYDWADKYMNEDKEFDLGISSDSIADTIAEGLADGKSGFKDFAGSFEDMMRTAVINSLKTKHLEGPLKEFQKKFSELSESGGQLTEAEIEELRGMYADIIDGAKVQFDSLKDIAGLDFTADSENSLKGAYAKASQESITLLAGQAGAQRVIMEDIRNNMIPIREQMLAIREMNSKGWEDVKLIRDLTVKIDKNSEQVAENTRMIHEVASKISENTRDTVDALEGTINVKIKGM